MIGRVKAYGRLRHRFWGEYSAAIVLGFDDEACAADALRVLGEPWRLSESTASALVAVFDSDALAIEKQRLGRYGADVDAIDSVRKSIDHGEPFEVTIDVTPSEQLWLFAEAS